MGGIAAVVNVYRTAGLFERFPITYVPTHCDGGVWAKLTILIRALFAFSGLLLRGEIGLLHVHTASRASFWRKSLFLLPAFASRIPVILHLHGAEFAIFYGRCGGLLKYFVRFVFNHSDRVIVLSSQWKSWVQGICEHGRVEAVYNPVLLPDVAALKRKRDRHDVLFLGRLGKRKGVYDLLDAVAQLAPEFSGLRLLLGGDGDLDGVRERAEALGIADRVRLLGWVRGADKEHLLASAGVYALPSYNEGLPMSVLEAMAAGLPILSSPVGGIPDAVEDGVEGYLVNPGDVAALATRLRQLLSDPGLAEGMGQAARRKIEWCFSAQAIIPRLGRIYCDLGVAPLW